MLKLEKVSSDRELNVIFRDKECFYTRSFRLAFLMAAAIHLFFFLLFHIAPIKLSFSETIFPPTHVESDLFLQNASVIAAIDASPHFATGLPPRPISVPLFDEYPKFLSVKDIDHSKEKNSTLNPFFQMEREIYEPQFPPLKKTGQTLPINIVVSGLLADKFLLNDGVKGKKLPGLPEKVRRQEEARAVFSVLVEGHSGRIFWYEPKQLTPFTALNQYAEMILKDFLFAQEKEAFVSSGEVELHFNFSVWETP